MIENWINDDYTMTDTLPAYAMKESFEIRAVIVGGGIVRLATAIALCRAGHAVTLLESKKDFTEVS